MEQLDIVKLIENNPITKLSNDYNVKFLTKIKTNFTDFEQQMFLSSFYCYLNHHPINDFVFDLDNIWKWIGFNQKYNAERLLENNFILNKDYIKFSNDDSCQNCLVLPKENQKKGRGGHNIKKVLLNIKTFKLMCLKSGTKKRELKLTVSRALSDEIEARARSEASVKRARQKENKNLKKEIFLSNFFIFLFNNNIFSIFI